MPKDKATYSIELEKDMMWFLEQMTTQYRFARRVENSALSGELCLVMSKRHATIFLRRFVAILVTEAV